MTRSEIRENVFKILFIGEFHPIEEFDEQERLFFNTFCLANESDAEYVYNRAKAIKELLPEIDEKIQNITCGWTINRIGKVELAILRLAYYEMHYDDLVPQNVAINEAVILAKKYGQDTSSAFINGVLAKLV